MPRVANLDWRDVLHNGALDLARRLDGAAAVAHRRERVLHGLVDLLGNGPVAAYNARRAPWSPSGRTAAALRSRGTTAAALAVPSLPLLKLLTKLLQLPTQLRKLGHLST